jgi:hypothetical protein
MSGAKAIVLGAAVTVGLAVAATTSGASKPPAPDITGPNATALGKHAYVLTSVEKGVPQSRLKFRCSLDSTTLRACRTA